jgi:hypothetical protein
VVANLGIRVVPALAVEPPRRTSSAASNSSIPIRTSSARAGRCCTKIAIGSGGFNGKGYLEEVRRRWIICRRSTPTSFFPVPGEELGFIGAIAVLLVFGVLIARALLAAQR